MVTEVALAVARAAVIVIVTVPLILLPSAVAAVMRAVPLATPVTVPAGSIAALAGSEVVHVTALAASSGSTAAASVRLSPTPTEGSAGVMATEVALTVTLTVTVPLILLPSAVAAVMMAVPLATPVTVPAGSIATLAGSEVVQVTA